MKDPYILYLSKRIDTLEQNQKEILELLKKAFPQNGFPEIKDPAQKATAQDKQALGDGDKRQKNP